MVSVVVSGSVLENARRHAACIEDGAASGAYAVVADRAATLAKLAHECGAGGLEVTCTYLAQAAREAAPEEVDRAVKAMERAVQRLSMQLAMVD